MNEEASDTPAMELPVGRSVGDVLTEEREAQGLSAADVARQLKLALRQVEALEAGEYERLPGATFVRGFVRNYARLLQLDPEPLLDLLRDVQKTAPAPAISSRNQNIALSGRSGKFWLWILVGIVLVVIIAPLVVYELLQGQPLAARKVRSAPSPVQLPHAVPEPAPVPVAPPVTGMQEPVQEQAGSASEPVNAEKVAAPPEAVSKVAAAGESTIRLNFLADAWVEVRDGRGVRIYSQLGEKGSEQTVVGKPPLSVVIGNAGNVRMTYNGKPVDLAPHMKVDVARLTLE
jgi:cytoskeleton protein RodZ